MTAPATAPEQSPLGPLRTEAGLPLRSPIREAAPGAAELNMADLAEMGRRGESNDTARTLAGTAFRQTIASFSPTELDRFVDHPELYPRTLAQRNEAFVAEPDVVRWLFTRQRLLAGKPHQPNSFNGFVQSDDPNLYRFDAATTTPSGDRDIVDATQVETFPPATYFGGFYQGRSDTTRPAQTGPTASGPGNRGPRAFLHRLAHRPKKPAPGRHRK